MNQNSSSIILIAAASLTSILISACGSAASTATASTTTTTTATTTTVSKAPDTTDLTQLPVGDYKYTTAPKIGYIFTCSQTFTGGGATVAGPWINSTTGTFNFTAKTVVQGSVPWPANSYTITLSGATRTVTTNDLPNHNTGTFPIASTDPIYVYDQNPNSIAAQTLSYSLPANPTAATETCLPNGIVGFMLTGAVIFNGLDAGGRDAVAHEGQDLCQGHPAPGSTYHYHSLTSCISDPGTAHSNLLGYALDGFGIFGSRGSDGSQLTDADLDECHGHTHSITWDGQTVTMYHYHATREYPYTIGCFHGTAVKANYVAGTGN
jgi:YHYH protein